MEIKYLFCRIFILKIEEGEMEKVVLKDLKGGGEELMFISENETEIKYMYLVLQEVYKDNKNIEVLKEEITPIYETFNDFLENEKYEKIFLKIKKD